MLTKQKLIELLSNYPDDMEIVDEQNRPIIHIVNTDKIIISTQSPIGICYRSGGNVYPSLVEGYVGFSPALDEDLYEFEFRRTSKF